ncbi:putative methyltransferase [Helianthus annuus]|nr:putative methyltransferase [Helianthus annuus]KAJ0857665.1 putative methyltransferase [Helianthus annuus]
MPEQLGQRTIKMATINVQHMNDGNGDSSYASNSFLQEHAIRRALPFLKHAIKDMANHDVFFKNDCFMIADLGCSSGMNTLLVASNIINILHEVCHENNRKTPQSQVCLNDLFGNDFNNLFKLLPDFYDNLKKDQGESIGGCFVSVVPGSFYGRLFPDKSLHFVHSSYSIQWLSQVPEGLESNKLNLYISKTSSLNVLQAYGKQFHADFTKFLELRYEEIVCGGHMFITLPGRSKVDPASDDCWSLWDLLTKSLLELLKEELIRESDINSFNFPFYLPCEDEVRNIIQDNGSFSVDNMNVYEVNWDPDDTDYTNMDDLNLEHNHSHNQGINTTMKNTAKVIRAITEPMLTSHFGSSIIDVLYKKYEKHVEERLATKKTRQFTIVISLTKNE